MGIERSIIRKLPITQETKESITLFSDSFHTGRVNPGMQQSEYNRISRSVAIKLRDVGCSNLRDNNDSNNARYNFSHARANLH